jgi:g-D-glutamyl-meso-diaminopimelate peptidase
MDIYQEISELFSTTSLPKRIIGKSVLGRNIYAFQIGKGYPVGIAQYALHGREWVTAKLALHHIRMGIQTGSFWIIPLANPDGALLSQQGLYSVSDEKRKEYLVRLNGGKDFALWKANARGVDLNVNFDARWGTGTQNVRKRGPENCIGTRPFSEKETRALARFTKEMNPNYSLSYHTKGEEIYWYFYQSLHTCPRDKRLAEVISTSTGYPLRETKNSAGGYKDWCIQTLKIPSFTIEVGEDIRSHPLTEKDFEDIRIKNENTLNDLAKEYQARQ